MFLIKLSLIILVGLFIARRIDQLISKCRVDIFSPWIIIPAVYVISFVVPAFTMPGYRPLPPYIISLNLIGLAAYFSGLYIARKVYQPDNIFPYIRKVNLDPTRLGQALIFLSVLGFSALSVIFIKHGIPLLSDNIEELRVAVYSNGYLAYLALSLNVVFVYALFFPSRLKLVLSGACFIALLLLGNRTIPFSLAVISLVIWHYLRQRIGLVKLFIASASLVFFASIISFFRLRNASYVAFILSGSFNQILKSIIANIYREFYITQDLFYRLSLVIPSSFPYQKGKCFWMMLFTILPGKQLSPHLFAGELLGLAKLGFGQALSTLGILYIDGGTCGIVIGMALTGFITALIYNWMRGKASFLGLVIYSFWISFMFDFIRSGIRFETTYAWYIFLILWTYQYSRQR